MMRALLALALIAAGIGAALALPPLWGALALTPGRWSISSTLSFEQIRKPTFFPGQSAFAAFSQSA